MSRKFAALIAGTVMIVTLGLGASPASAHDMNCDKGKFGHRYDVEKNHKQVMLDAVPGVICFQVRKNHIRYIVNRGRHVWRQDVVKIKESGAGPFFTSVTYVISAVRYSGVG